MDEYICKNSVREKPCSVKLFEHKLEFQCGDKKDSIPYANIVSINLNKVRNKYIMQIESDYQGTLLITNRFYITNREFEDRSRQYNTFVRMLHLHLAKQKTTTFFSGTSFKTIFLLLTISFMSCLCFQLSVTYFLGYLHWPLLSLTVIAFLIICMIAVKKRPQPYDGNQIPLDYVPSITSW